MISHHVKFNDLVRLFCFENLFKLWRRLELNNTITKEKIYGKSNQTKMHKFIRGLAMFLHTWSHHSFIYSKEYMSKFVILYKLEFLLYSRTQNTILPLFKFFNLLWQYGHFKVERLIHTSSFLILHGMSLFPFSFSFL